MMQAAEAGVCADSADEVHSIVSGKLALKYIGDEVDAMKEIAQASHKRSLAQFESVCMLTSLYCL